MGHVIVLAAALTCLRLGWWQWGVYEDIGGTSQNLGYSLLWPVFAVSFIYMWLRFLQLEEQHSDDLYSENDDSGDTSALAGGITLTQPAEDSYSENAEPRLRRTSRGSRWQSKTRTVGMGFIGDDDDDDPELAAYNAALAQLAEQEKRRDH